MPPEFTNQLTRSPQLNEVIRLAEEVWNGHGDEEALGKSLRDLTMLRRELRKMLRHGLRFQEKNSAALAEAPKIEQNLEALREGIDEMYRFFKDNRNEHLEKGVDLCRTAFSRLFVSFDMLKEEEDRLPVHSELPYQNELMRLGYGVIRGTVSSSAFRERLEVMRTTVLGFYEGFDRMTPHPAEKNFFDEHRESFKKALRSYLKGIDEAARYFADGSVEHVRKGMEMTGEASAAILEFQKALVKASEGPRQKLCFRCGKENDGTARFCASCNAAFPAFEGAVPSGMELRMDSEGNVRDSAHSDTDFSRSLTSAVASVKEGSITGARFQKILDDMEKKLHQAHRDREKLGSVQGMAVDEQARECLEEIDEMMLTGLSEIREGLEQMRRYGESGDESHLAFGLESALSGADRLLRVQVLTSRAKNG